MADMKNHDKKDRKDRTQMDHPEQYPTEKESLFDQYEEELHVDPIPVQDLNMEKQEEKDKEATKQNSSTEEKYRADYRD
ncbi:hypothetical protein [Paenibacillus sp. PDC88]|uniref:hypothetical protein n=1 Tax=Paenibacillus sp. PDC88 TaxID=1884375 RepID=UPI00089C6988|nr:hypothetical protein [Paenibacillus sp. PDC88]SDW12286.1 hypothetical protein SAMN05518848_101322 [Paenibacillus sp. PDC88]